MIPSVFHRGSAVLALNLIATFGVATFTRPVQADTGDPTQAATALLARWQAETGAPGVSAAVSVNGKIVYSAGLGQSDLESGTPQNGRSIHNIGSISKTQAVVAVMQLVERGKVKLDDEVQAYVPWFPRKAKPITVRQILTHTSGIRHYKDGEFGPADVLSFRHYDSFEESTRFWRDDPLVFEPGTHWMYSSFATNLMHGIVEAAGGQGFEAYLAEHVWKPAGMSDTSFDVPSRIVKRRGRGYVREDGKLENARAEDVSYKYAGGGMISTDEDMCRFGTALNGGVLLKPETLKEMYRLQLPKDIPYTDEEIAETQASASAAPPSRGLRQGLIFAMDRAGSGRVTASHGGSVKGTESQFSNFYRDGIVVALHFNLADAEPKEGMREAADALARIFVPVKASN
jgi:serine beta-lactamase-like protein LACTB